MASGFGSRKPQLVKPQFAPRQCMAGTYCRKLKHQQKSEKHFRSDVFQQKQRKGGKFDTTNKYIRVDVSQH